jgi:flagellin-like hook-associated protein FlgL
MTRITSSASNTILISRFLQTQRTLHDLETQVGTEKRSQTYQGLALSSQRLLNIENTKASLERYNTNNIQAQLRLDVQTTAVTGIKDAIKDFRELLLQFNNGDMTDPERVQQIQEDAFRALKDIQNLLNTEADGRYVFGGGTLRTEPVSFGLSTVAAFQEKYDGARVTFPTTRSAHLEDFSISRNSQTLNPAYLTFEQADAGTGKSRINSTVDQFSNIEAGTTITISGTVDGLNDGVYTVDSVDPNGLWIDVRTEQLTDEATPVFATFTYPNPDNLLETATFSTDVVFDRRTNTITASTTGALDSIPEGSSFTVSGSVSNDGTYTVSSNDGTDLVIESQRFVSDGGTGSTVHTAGGANSLTFSNATGANGEDQLIAATAGTYSSLENGQKIKINNTNTENDGKIFTVQSVSADGTTITLASDENVDITIPTVTTGIVSHRPELFSFNAAERNFYFDADAVGASADTVSFTDNGANADTITLNGATFTDAKGNLLPAGARITVTNAGANDGTYTVASISTDGTTATLVATDTLTTAAGDTDAVLAGTGSITFADNTPNADTITLGGGAFRDADGNNLAAGTIFSLAGTGTANDGTNFTIASVSSDGRTATLIPTDTIDDTTPTVTAGTLNAVNTIGTISATSYYQGDTTSLTHRVSSSQSFEFSLTGVDPAFEKAIRGMFLVLQGATGSEGGLDQNQNRVSEAMYLMDDALDRTNSTPPPFGTELDSNIEELEISLGYRAVLLADVEASNEQIIGFLDNNIAEIENIDPLDAITRLLDNQRVLEASYQTFARVRQLSLTKFI